MQYLFYNHYYIEPMNLENSQKIILLAEPEAESRALYTKHLASANMLVEICEDLSQLIDKLASFEPDLLIVNPGTNPAHSLVFLQQVKKNQPTLSIITIGYGTPEEYLDRFMELGVSCHINRNLTRPQDVVVAAQQVLENIYSLNT